MFNGFWAISPQLLKEYFEAFKAVSTTQGKPLKYSRLATTRGKTAIIPIHGIITPHENLFSNLFGFSTVDSIASDTTAALKNRDIKNILLDVDSGGGNVDGIHELANIIEQASTKKPIYGYVGSFAASAAYWLLPSAQKIFVDKTASVGSIGVIYVSRNEAEDTLVITSSNAPKKHLPPDSEEGKTEIQAQIDFLENIFIEDVARRRGVTTDFVKASFGQGGLVTGSQAVENNMVDGLSSFELTLKTLRGVSIMDEHQIQADLKAEINRTFDELEKKLVAKFEAAIDSKVVTLVEQVKAEVESSYTQAKEAERQVEQERIADIDGLFEMLADESGRKEAYQKLRGDCLAEGIDYRTARNRIIQLRQTTPLEQPPAVAQANYQGQPIETPPDVQFEQKVKAFMDGGMTQAKAMQEAACAYPELHQAWLISQQGG